MKTPKPEEGFQKTVIDLAQLYGWLVAHFRPSLNGRGQWRTAVAADGAGFFDLVLVRGPRVLFVELKAGKNKSEPDQLKWQQAMLAAGQTVYVWRPEQWDDVVRILEPVGG